MENTYLMRSDGVTPGRERIKRRIELIEKATLEHRSLSQALQNDEEKNSDLLKCARKLDLYNLTFFERFAHGQ